MINIKPKILAAMSGGVDSSVTAALLLKEGYEVIGATMQLSNKEQESNCYRCLTTSVINDAKKVAKKLGIEHHVIDCSENFQKIIIDYFIESYQKGETPCPCAKCNRFIKFAELIAFAKKIGCEKLATGHYARIIKNKNVIELHKAVDSKKDQSYFLSLLTKEQLEFVMFPLGNIENKAKTRNLAKDFNIEVAEKPESQDLCFISDNKYINFIKTLRPELAKEGDIVHVNGEILGKHNGIINYTIGQRKGLGISYAEPIFVVEINANTNEIIVGSNEDLMSKEFTIKDFNWIGGSKKLETGDKITAIAKIRSTNEGEKAEIIIEENDTARVIMKNSTRAITPGQLCALYNDTQVLGGGWIDKIIRN